MKTLQAITRLFFLFFYFAVCLTLTASPSTTPNNRYSNAGIATFDTTPYYNTATTTLNPSLFTISFSRSQTTTTYKFGCSIQNFNYQITNNKLNYSVIPSGSNTASSAQLALYTNNANKISVLKISYIVIEPLFGSYYFSYRMLNPNRNMKQNTASSYTEISSTDGPFNTSKTYTLWITILGVDATMATNNQIDLYPSASVSGTDNITYVIQTISPTQFYLTSIVMMAFIYDTTELQAYNRNALLTVGTLGNTYTSSLSTTDSTNSVRSYNTIIGMIGFHILSLSYLQFSSVYTPNNGISFSSSYSFNYVNFNYLIATFAYCAPATPYLFVSTRVCYDVCPVRSSTDSFYYECQSCPTYDCYYCGTNGLCTQCSATVDFRTMNASNSRCVPLDGYYDDGSHSQAVACNASACLTCTSLTFCLSCQTGKYLTSSNNCATCIANCYNCTNGTSCVQCNTGYVFLSSNNTCFLNCSTIANCLTCSYTTSLNCNSCSGGYQLASNACNSVCGDGNRTSDENCDDGNTVNGDGCSSACKIQTRYFCSDTMNGTKVLSTCAQCSSNCNICVNASNCTNCSTGYTLLANRTCFLNCSSITNCLTCSYSSSLICNSCVNGYQIISNACNTVCGDGNRASNEGCDDGNTVSADGCSSTCTVQLHYFCADTANGSKILSVCTGCSSNCDYCTNASYCSNCSNGFSVNVLGSTAVCTVSCTPNCNSCNSVTCLGCIFGFTLNASSNCNPVCGDGIIKGIESCDDGNTVNGDGCNSLCQIEPYFTCTTNALGTSVCSLTSLAVQFQSLTKDEFSNSLTLSYKVTPITANSLKSLDWSAITAQTSNLSLTLSQFSYDSSLSSLQISAQYQQTLSDRQLALQFSFPNSAPFDLLGNKSSSVSLSASNNLSLWVYDSLQYQAAYYLKFVMLGLTAFALLLFVVGYYSGKLIALQLLAIYQLAYFSMLSVSNLSPGFVALKNLCYSNGYFLSIFADSKITDQSLSFLNYTLLFANNFNLNLILVILPLFLALFAAVSSFGKSKQSLGQSQKQNPSLSQRLHGQFVYYGLMFCFYSLIVPLVIIFKNIVNLSLMQLCFLLVGIFILILGIIYNCLLRKFPKNFGEFTEFVDGKTVHYYYFLQFQRIIVSLLLVVLIAWKYQLLTILGILLIKLMILLRKKPYHSNGGNLRPFLNCITQIMIASIFCLYDFIGSLIFQFHYYAPYFIVGHLTVALGYNYYFFFKNLKKRCKQKSRQSKVGDFESFNQRTPFKNKWSYAKAEESVSKII